MTLLLVEVFLLLINLVVMVEPEVWVALEPREQEDTMVELVVSVVQAVQVETYS